MKIKTSCVCFLMLSLLVAGSVGGCASGAYPTLRNTEVNVDAQMTRYRNAVTQDRVTLGMQQQVTQAYNAYKAGFDAALKEAGNSYSAHTPDNVQTLANQLFTTLGEVPTF